MTKARIAVLAAIDGAEEPLSASGVAARANCDCDQATVYRALHHLETAGFAESFVLNCSEHGTERYYVSAKGPHRHWFHCEGCHRFVDLGACRIGGLVADLESELGLRVTRHTMYLSGLCAECSARSAPRAGAH
ncbi:MAG: transcriptional repressor [Spirochaetae bacterium HGW-Spirochaetae-3]|jgi:Fur family ferric uptake transcriptional regulator|nr:MAG: transcriptional repressor [Spirochaetae bacterium HGW-Spirochaetae-3]